MTNLKGFNFAILILAIFASSLTAADPPAPLPAKFRGLVQDCEGGFCPIPQETIRRPIRNVVSEVRNIVKNEPIVKSVEVKPVEVISIGQATCACCGQPVPNQEVSELKSVLTQPVINETVYSTPVVQYSNPQPVVVSRNICNTSRRRVFQGRFLSRLRSRLRPQGVMRNSRAVFQPAGQTLRWHLENEHGVNTAGMSYNQMLSVHTQIHGG